VNFERREIAASEAGGPMAYAPSSFEGKRLGRPRIADKLAERIRAALAGGMSVRKTAAKFEVNPSTVQRISRPFGGVEDACIRTCCHPVVS
jgi:hypothetical protein